MLFVNAARDYCQWDTFEASCPSRDQLVVMKSAVYGRMASGPCIERDYGYVGCHSDVLSQADTRCSGRRRCQLDIPYQPFDVGHPCPKDLTRFLRASFVCVKGQTCLFSRLEIIIPIIIMMIVLSSLAERKSAIYCDASASYIIQPSALETHGPINETAMLFLVDQLGRKTAAVSTDYWGPRRRILFVSAAVHLLAAV